MRNELTISELARMMQVSVHQVRYFEEKGVLMPMYTDDNKYRMYGIDQVYRLAEVLLLRKLGMSVQTIKETLAADSAYDMEKMLNKSLSHTAAEIQRLQELEYFIRKVLQEHHNFDAQGTGYWIQRRGPIHLKQWLEIGKHTKPNARLLAEQAGQVPDLFEAELHYVIHESGAALLYTETDAPADLLLQEADYLCHHFSIRDESEVEDKVEQFLRHAESEQLKIADLVVLIEKAYLSLFTKDHLHYELLARIETDCSHPPRSNPS